MLPRHGSAEEDQANAQPDTPLVFLSSCYILLIVDYFSYNLNKKLSRKKHHPEILLLDEITSALDPESKHAVLDLFRKDGYTIISVSHDPDWFKTCSIFIKVENGKISRISDSPDNSAFLTNREIDRDGSN